MRERLRSFLFCSAGALLAMTPCAVLADGPTESWFGVGTYAGAIFLDQHLSDYRWDTSPHAVWGLQGFYRRDRYGAGARVWRTGTTQSLGLLDAGSSPSVNLTGVDLVVEPKVGAWRGLQFFGMASGGLLHISYSPDSFELDDPGSGEPVRVDAPPIDEWTFGAGLGLRHHVPGRATLGFSIEHSVFRLDTAHRNDDVIVENRETFGNWTARFELSRWFFSI
jgi:hypothetical protein